MLLFVFSLDFSLLLQSFGLLLSGKGIYDTVEPTVYHSVDIKIPGFTGKSVVSNSVLWKIIRPYPVAAVTGADLTFALRRDLCVSLRAFCLIQPGAQDAHGTVFVLILAAFILTFHHRTRGQMGDADGALCFIDMLPPAPEER